MMAKSIGAVVTASRHGNLIDRAFSSDAISSGVRVAFWPVVFLSWLPFIASNGVVLTTVLTAFEDGFDSAELRAVMQTLPYYSWTALVVLGVSGCAAIVMSRRSRDDEARSHMSAGQMIVALLPLLALLVFTLGVRPAHEFVGSGTGPDTTSFAIFSLLYLIAMVLSLAQFTLVGRLGDDYFFHFCCLMFVDCLLGPREGGFLIFGSVLNLYTPSPIGLALFFLGVFALRASVLAYRQNRGISQAEEFWPSMRRAAFLWLPMPIFFGVMWYFYFEVERNLVVPATINYLHDFDRRDALDHKKAAMRQLDPEIDPNTITVPGALGVPRPDTIEDAMIGLLARQQAKYIAEADANIAATRQAIADKSEDARLNARNSIEAALPERMPGTETVKCGWLDVVCLLKNGVKSMANSAYQQTKRKQLDSMQAEIDDLHSKQDQLGDGYAQAMTAAVNYRITLIGEAAVAATRQISRTLTLFRYVLALYSLLVLAKSFAIVFARVFYSRVPFGDRLGEDDQAAADRARFGKITKHGERFLIPNNSTTSYYLRPKFAGPNVIERRRIPQWGKVILGRILSGAYVLIYVDTREKDQVGCYALVEPPGRIVEWELADGEEAVFHTSDMVGFSSTVSLSSRINARLSSLLFGRVIYHCAVGPGTLLLHTRAEPIAGRDRDAAKPLSIYGFIARNVRNEYFVRAHETMTDTFFSGCSLQRTKGDLIVFDTSRERVGKTALGGIWRLGRTFLLPF
jgi:hypothetical protein